MKVSGAGIHTVSGKWGELCCWHRGGCLGSLGHPSPLLVLEKRPYECRGSDHLFPSQASQLLTTRPHQAAPDSGPRPALVYHVGTWPPKCAASADRVQRWGEESLGQVYSRDLQPFLSFCRTWATWPTLGALIFLLVWPRFLVSSLILSASQPIMTRAHPISKPVPSDFSKPAS